MTCGTSRQYPNAQNLGIHKAKSLLGYQHLHKASQPVNPWSANALVL